MKNKGFTLIELLAVVVILGILALITTPIIIGVIDKSRKNAFEETVKGLIRAVDIDNDRQGYKPTNYKVIDGELYDDKNKKVDTNGGSNENGVLSTNSDGEILVSVNNGRWCATKDFSSNKIEIADYTDSNCKLGNLKEEIEKDSGHIKKNVKVNGEIVNKVIGTKSEQTTMKNYVWYMGQLWQVLETNDTNNTIKLITAQSITSIAYGETSDYNSSWVKKWLNEVFYASLEGTELVKNTKFCLDKVNTSHESIVDIDPNEESRTILKVNSHTPISTCKNVINEKVGLMSFEDYVYSNKGNAPVYIGNSYLDDDDLEWTLTAYDDTHNWIQWFNTRTNSYITSNNDTFSTVKDRGHGIRPVISIDSSSIVKDGDGTKRNPYILLNEKKANIGSTISNVKVGDYIYLDESNNPNKFTEEYVARSVKYATTKDKVRYRVVKKNEDGTVKVERADILKNLPNNIAIKLGIYVPYYYKAGTNGCYYNSDTDYQMQDCENNNIFSISGNTGNYDYKNSINIGDYLNSSTNGFYNWYSEETKKMIKETQYDRFTGGNGKDYSNLNDNETGVYPSTTNDGKITAKVVLPSWGEMYTGNDLNYSYWYINRFSNSPYSQSYIVSFGNANGGVIGHNWLSVRPVVTLKSSVKIKSGEGTMTNPYSLSN